MKDITQNLINLFKQGYCTPQIARIAKYLKQPSTTIHYNIKKLEKNGAVKAYKAVFDYKKINQAFCSFVLLNLSPNEYGDPEKIAKELAKHPSIESVDICTGECEIIIKVRTKNQDEYYELVKNVISKKGIIKIKSLLSLRQIKSEFVKM